MRPELGNMKAQIDRDARLRKLPAKALRIPTTEDVEKAAANGRAWRDGRANAWLGRYAAALAAAGKIDTFA